MQRHPYLVLCAAFVLVVVVYIGLGLGVMWVGRTWEDSAAVAGVASDVFFIAATGAVGLAALWRALRDMFSPRAAAWIAGLAALAFAAILVHGLASGDARGFGKTFGPVAGSCLPVWLVCTALCGGGAALRKRNWRVLAVLLRAAGLSVAFCVVCALGAGWFGKAPFGAGFRVESTGEPPREIVLSRAWCGWWKSCDLRLYVHRDGDGRWEAWSFGYWPYPLGECVVEFPDVGAPLAKPKPGWGFSWVGQRPRDEGAGSDGKPGPRGGEPDYPGELSPAELHALHRELCKPSAAGGAGLPDDGGRELQVDEGWVVVVLGAGDAVAGRFPE